MTGPAYHLRPNKAADRHLFIEAIRRLTNLGDGDLSGYTYHGLGGPLLEDFRQLYEAFPKIPMVSIEEHDQVYKRQQHHIPCSTVELRKGSLESYISSYNPGCTKSIFWLDYTRLMPEYFECFQRLLRAVAPNSMIKITLPVDPDEEFAPDSTNHEALRNEFLKKFNPFKTDPHEDPPDDPEGFAFYVQKMLRSAAQDALRAAAKGRIFMPVSSFRYSDGTPMLTLTGVVCEKGGKQKLKKTFGDWEFVNMAWKQPRLINVPILSTKERLRLQPLLPCMSALEIYRELEYWIGNDEGDTKEKLKQYVLFHRHVPYFLKGVP